MASLKAFVLSYSNPKSSDSQNLLLAMPNLSLLLSKRKFTPYRKVKNAKNRLYLSFMQVLKKYFLDSMPTLKAYDKMLAYSFVSLSIFKVLSLMLEAF